MSVLWLEGFNVDRSTNALSRKYAAIAVGAGLNVIAGPRENSMAWGGQTALTYLLTHDLTDQLGAIPSTVVVGLRLRASDVAEVPVITMLRGVVEQISLYLIPAAGGDWSLQVRRGVDILREVGPYPAGEWRTVELKATLEDRGRWWLHVAGGATASGKAHLAGFYTPGADRIAFAVQKASSGGACDITDLYVVADDGIGETDFLGDVEARAVRAEAPGDLAEWVPSGAGDNVDLWKQDGVDLDTSYVRSLADGESELATVEDPGDASDGVVAVMFGAFGKIGTDGQRGLRALGVRGTEIGTGAGLMMFTATADYEYRRAVEERHPADAAPWTVPTLAAGQIGFRTTPA